MELQLLVQVSDAYAEAAAQQRARVESILDEWAASYWLGLALDIATYAALGYSAERHDHGELRRFRPLADDVLERKRLAEEKRRRDRGIEAARRYETEQDRLRARRARDKAARHAAPAEQTVLIHSWSPHHGESSVTRMVAA